METNSATIPTAIDNETTSTDESINSAEISRKIRENTENDENKNNGKTTGSIDNETMSTNESKDSAISRKIHESGENENNTGITGTNVANDTSLESPESVNIDGIKETQVQTANFENLITPSVIDELACKISAKLVLDNQKPLIDEIASKIAA